jgi:hypothetical protein
MLAEKHNHGNDIQETHTEHKHRDESQISERGNFCINFKGINKS